MSINTVIKAAKVVVIATTVVIPAIDGATVVTKRAAKFVKSKLDNSEKVQEIKKDFELRREGIITVDYQEC
jgi:hypothetical protein